MYCRPKDDTLRSRAVDDSGPESAPEYDRSMIFTIWRFRLRIRLFSKVESVPVVEPAPVLESAPRVESAHENEHSFTQ